MKLKNNLLEIKITKACSVEELLQTYLISRKQRYLLFQNRQIKVNDQLLSQSIPLKKNDIVQISLQEERDTICPWEIPLDICYEDEVLLIVNKPSGMLVHSDGNNTANTLCNAVQAYYQKSGQHHLVRPIHRLDVETSGLLLFCKCSFFQPLLDHLLMEKQIHREYLAFVEGKLPKQQMIIEKAIGKDRHNSKKMRISKQGKYAKTLLQVKQQFPAYALIRCQLFTGRTHQIRVHLASIQHPLLSDSLYGHCNSRIPRLALHAYRMCFYHPLLEKELIVECPLPKDMKNLLR